jgi:hypothetical protein
MGEASRTFEKKTSQYEEDDDTAEQRVDSDGSYIPRSDNWYIGEIPEGCTVGKLVKIMAKAIVKYGEDMAKWTDEKFHFDQVGDILDRWLDHDHNGPNKFDHLVSGGQFEEFIDKVIAKAKKIKST